MTKFFYKMVMIISFRYSSLEIYWYKKKTYCKKSIINKKNMSTGCEIILTINRKFRNSMNMTIFHQIVIRKALNIAFIKH